MRKYPDRHSWAALALLIAMLTGCDAEPEWTTASEEALREFELGQEARMKLYSSEAHEHFARALELDPDFAAAKLVMAGHAGEGKARDGAIEELRAIDRSRLNERERFLIELTLARMEHRQDDAEKLADAYSKVAPEDPYGLVTLAEEAWRRQEWAEAESLYRRLLEVEPNWVLAQNHLGYLAMAQGRFEQAEEHFETYIFIAPDQANPHDSMGELLTVTGRYQEALTALETALAIRPDFCASHLHILDVLVLEGRPYDGYEVLERAEEACSSEDWQKDIARARCQLAFWADYLEGDFDSPWRDDRAECKETVGPRSFLIHRLAVLSGRFPEATEIEEAVREDIEKRAGAPEEALQVRRGVLRHLEGVRLIAKGEAEEAERRMREADSMLWYWGQDQSILKLFNRLNLVYALEISGRQDEADRLLADVAAVNRPFAEAYPDIRANFES